LLHRDAEASLMIKSGLRRSSRPATIAVAAVLFLTTSAGTAAAGTATAGSDVLVRGPSALTACSAGASADFAAAYDDTEVEPQVAVNPLNPLEIVGVTQQDRWPDGGARGLTSWMSQNGGLSWVKLADAPWAACQGGPSRFGRVTDPWVSYDRAGNLYFIGQPIDLGALERSAISVTTLNRATGAWNAPQILIEDSASTRVSHDKVSVTGDPTRAGYAYATWLRISHPAGARQSENADLHSLAWRGYPMISRTQDAGRTWSPPVPMRRSNSFFQGNQIAVAPDGTLFNVTANLFTGAGQNDQGVYLGVMKSTDAGLHWSAPVQIAPIRTTQLFVSDDDFPIRAGDYLPDIAIDPRNGTIYVVWADGLGTALNRIVMVKSTDGGRHWTPPVTVSSSASGVQAFNHAIEVTPDGTVFVAFYDDRENDLGDGIATTDVWLRHSHNGGTTWTEQHLHGPFDHYQAPISYVAPGDPRGLFLGDYIGLEATGSNDVVAFFSSTIADGADAHSIVVSHP
jgi:hypothetical protein